MSENAKPNCPECDDPGHALDRRGFIRVVGGTAAALTLAGTAGLTARAADTPKPTDKKPRPAEELVKELFTGLSDDQKKTAVYAYDEKGGPSGLPKRLGMYNGSIGTTIGKVYTKPQIELVERILKAIAADEEGFTKLTRNGTYDNSGSLENCGAHIFGNPMEGDWCWLFTGHHLTVRCDGNFKDGIGFGGPMYYGHSPNGYGDKNCFFFQTKRVLDLYAALDEKQRKQALVLQKGKEQYESVKIRKPEEVPGLLYADLSKDLKTLVEAVMRDLLSPYRKEDADEVMEIVKTTGGMEKIRLAFFHGGEPTDKQPCEFWRLEGPGFVWNYRVLPHVHTYVNITSKA